MRPVDASKPPSMIPTWQEKWLLTTLPSGASKTIINRFNTKALRALWKGCGLCIGRAEDDPSSKPRARPTHSTDLETKERGSDLSMVPQRISSKAGMRITFPDWRLTAHSTSPFYDSHNPRIMWCFLNSESAPLNYMSLAQRCALYVSYSVDHTQLTIIMTGKW